MVREAKGRKQANWFHRGEGRRERLGVEIRFVACWLLLLLLAVKVKEEKK